MRNHRMYDSKIEIYTDYLVITEDMLSALILTAIEHASMRKSGRPDEWVKFSVGELNRTFFDTQSNKTISKKIYELQNKKYLLYKILENNVKYFKINSLAIKEEVQKKLLGDLNYAAISSDFMTQGVFPHTESKTYKEEMEEMMRDFIQEQEEAIRTKAEDIDIMNEEQFQKYSGFKTTKFFNRIIEMDKYDKMWELKRRFRGE